MRKRTDIRQKCRRKLRHTFCIPTVKRSGSWWLYNSPVQRPLGSLLCMIFLIPDRHFGGFLFNKKTKGIENVQQNKNIWCVYRPDDDYTIRARNSTTTGSNIMLYGSAMLAKFNIWKMLLSKRTNREYLSGVSHVQFRQWPM